MTKRSPFRYFKTSPEIIRLARTVNGRWISSPTPPPLAGGPGFWQSLMTTPAKTWR